MFYPAFFEVECTDEQYNTILHLENSTQQEETALIFSHFCQLSFQHKCYLTKI